MITRDLSDNPGFAKLREMLRTKGIELRCMAQARITPVDRRFRFPDIETYRVIGESRPAIRTIVVQDYGEDGFGLWVDPETNDLAGIATMIAGK